MVKCARWFPPVSDEIVLYLFYKGNFVCLVVWTMDDEARGFIINEDIIISVEYSLWFEFFMYDSSFCLALFPDLQNLGWYVYMKDIASSELRILREFLSSKSYLFRTEGLKYFSEFCSGEYFSHISIKSLTEVVAGWCDVFHGEKVFDVLFC